MVRPEYLSILKVHRFVCVVAIVLQTADARKRSTNPVSLTIKPPPLIGDKISHECWNFTFGDWKKMEFYSPNYPNKYPNKTECYSYFEAPPGFRIQLDFRDKFDLEPSEECKYDFLEVRDGPFGYSPLLGRYCGSEFPPLIETSSRYIWLRFKTDELVPYGGFRAVYSYITDETYTREEEKMKVCRTLTDSIAPDGILTSDRMPLIDPSYPGFPVSEPLDCTWEIHVPRDSMVRLSDISLGLPNPGKCEFNMVEVYKSSTLERDRIAHTCSKNLEDITADSNRVFVRIFGKTVGWKPKLHMLYTAFTTGECDSNDFDCEGICVNRRVRCNGRKNCPGEQDEENCDQFIGVAGASEAEETIPLHAIILGAVGGIFFTAVAVGIVITCKSKRRDRKNKKEAMRQSMQRKNAFEMAVSQNSSPTMMYQKQNGGMNVPSYYSLPRPNGGMAHRTSLASSLQPPSEGEYGDHVSDPGNYKRFLSLDNSFDADSSPCPSLYNQGNVFTTVVERHPIPQHITDLEGTPVWTGYGWQQSRNETPSPTSLSANLSKLSQYAQYTIPKNPNIGSKMGFNPETKNVMAPETKFKMAPETKLGMTPDLVMNQDSKCVISPETKIEDIQENKFSFKPDIKFSMATESKHGMVPETKPSLIFKNIEADIHRELEAT